MCRHEGFHPFDDLFSRLLAPCVDMACRELLPVAGGAAGLQRVHHIILCGIDVKGIGTLKDATGGAGASVVIDDQWIAPFRIEMWRQVITSINLVAIGAGEAPILHLTQLQLVEPFGVGIGDKGGRKCLEIQQIAP